MDVFTKSGSHPLNAQYNKLVEELKSLGRLIDKKRREEEKTIHRGWVVDKVVVDEVYQDTGAEVFYIYIRPCARALREQKAHMDTWGSSIINPQDRDKTQRSIAYMYMPQAGVIIEGGHGGFIVLKNADGRQPFDKRPIPCTPAEWEAIKQGKLPSHMDNMNTEKEEDF